MSMKMSTAGPIVVCLVLFLALVGCSGSDVSEPSAKTPPSSGPTSAEQSARVEALAEVAASASERATEMPTLLLIVNTTTHEVLLTSVDGKNTATIDPGKSLQLASKRVCDWLPLTASTADGRMIEQYTQPCHGQTWTITDQGAEGHMPPCDLDNLRLEWVGAGPAMGTYYATTRVTNNGEDCVVPASTSVRLNTPRPRLLATVDAAGAGQRLRHRDPVLLRLGIAGFCFCEPLPGADPPPYCGAEQSATASLSVLVGGQTRRVAGSEVPSAIRDCPKFFVLVEQRDE